MAFLELIFGIGALVFVAGIFYTGYSIGYTVGQTKKEK
jgi:1,4-dihydroxy-2-naphthoate octaprenyltransferase